MEIKVTLSEDEVCNFVGTALVPHLGLDPDRYTTRLELVGYPQKLEATFTPKLTDPYLPSV